MTIVLKIGAMFCAVLLFTHLTIAQAVQDSTDLSQAFQDSTADSSTVDSISVITPGGQVRKIVKRDFNPKEQVLIGTSIMTFIVIILTTVANWNP